MKVKMLVNTNYKGFRQIDEEIEVPKEVAIRWVTKGIAAYVEEVEEEEIMEIGTTFENMSVKQLYKICIKQGLDVEPKRSKEYYIDELNSLSDDVEVEE